MRKKYYLIVIATIVMVLTGCASLQNIPVFEQDAVTQLAAKIAAKRVGYAVAKNNPQYASDMVAYAEALANANDSEKLINEALPLAISKLSGFAVDPILQSDIEDLVTLISLTAPDVDIQIKSNLARAALAGFIEGCRLAK
jgi:hypothetical protein